MIGIMLIAFVTTLASLIAVALLTAATLIVMRERSPVAGLWLAITWVLVISGALILSVTS